MKRRLAKIKALLAQWEHAEVEEAMRKIRGGK